MKKIILNINDEFYFKLQKLKKELQIPTSKIIIMIINDKLEDFKILEKQFIENLNIKNINNETEIRFRIKEKEKIFLKKQIEKTGNKSLTSEVRFRLLNTIYRNKFFLPSELKELSNLNFQIKRIGLNINGIFKRVNFKEELKNEDYKKFQNSINEVNKKIDLVSNEIKKFLKFSNNRF